MEAKRVMYEGLVLPAMQYGVVTSERGKGAISLFLR